MFCYCKFFSSFGQENNFSCCFSAFQICRSDYGQKCPSAVSTSKFSGFTLGFIFKGANTQKGIVEKLKGGSLYSQTRNNIFAFPAFISEYLAQNTLLYFFFNLKGSKQTAPITAMLCLLFCILRHNKQTNIYFCLLDFYLDFVSVV